MFSLLAMLVVLSGVDPQPVCAGAAMPPEKMQRRVELTRERLELWLRKDLQEERIASEAAQVGAPGGPFELRLAARGLPRDRLLRALPSVAGGFGGPEFIKGLRFKSMPSKEPLADLELLITEPEKGFDHGRRTMKSSVALTMEALKLTSELIRTCFRKGWEQRQSAGVPYVNLLQTTLGAHGWTLELELTYPDGVASAPCVPRLVKERKTACASMTVRETVPVAVPGGKASTLARITMTQTCNLDGNE